MLRKMELPNTISSSVKIGLHFIGIWPGTPFPTLHKIYWIVVSGLFQVFQYRYVVQHYGLEAFRESVDNFCVALAFTQLNVKLIISWIYYSVLCDILSTMEEECKKYAAMDTDKLILKTARLSYVLTTTILTMYVIGPVTHIAGTAATAPRNSSPLFLKMDLPFDMDSSSTYGLVLAGQFFYQTSGAYAFGVFSALILMVVLHVGYQIDIMCQTVTDMPIVDKEQLRFFIKRHQDIIIFTEKIEKYFTYIALSQLFTNTLVTCCLGVMIVIVFTTGGGAILVMKYLMFFVNIWVEAYIYCFSGEYLSTKSKLICESAYRCLWYDLRRNESQLLIIVILRSQKGFKFTFGKFSSLSLENFTSILKASGSYMSVLLAMS
ncbi:odorant receptor 4-like [Megachile rotundata]|uniref:odorant receptor 4-like n=1 Tax=Megachile rotundata TaxID=143995 RepID=UPI003FCFFCD3